MNNRRAILIASAAVIAIGAVVVLTLRTLAPAREATPATGAAPTAAVATTRATKAPAAATAAGEETPPWLQSQATAGTTVGATTQTPEQRLREQQLQRLQQSMRGLTEAATARSGQTRQHMTAALDTLEQMHDPAVAAQVDLKAVRRNLDTSYRMQDLALELQKMADQPASPERQQRMEAIIAEVRKLQSQLVLDVRAPGSTLPAPIPTLPAR